MKIPETTPNVGAYYGNEENGQWQVLGVEGMGQQDIRLLGVEQSNLSEELARLKSEARTLKNRIRNAAPVRRQKVVDEYLQAKEKYESLAKKAQMAFCEGQDRDLSLPNGVIIDSGVGGGVVGSGDAGIHRPPVYPVHIPRAHMPGYVMAGAYYPPAAYPPVPTQPQPDDFADYMWMENEEEFDKQVMQQLEEEALMEQCIEAMLEDEQRERTCRNNRTHNGHNHHHYPTTSNGGPSLSLEETVSRSTLNPLAAEFVPTRPLPAATDGLQEPPPAPSSAPATQPATEHTQPEHTDVKTEEPVPPQTDPPEVSAADTIERRPKDKNSKTKVEVKKQAVKQEVKSKSKPSVVKSETKVAKKKEGLVKTVRSEVKVEEKTDEVVVVPDLKPQPTPVESQETQPTSGFKPINYAAAAKANKPKKPQTTTIDTKPQTQPKIEKKISEKIDNKKDKLKTEKVNVQRKNSAK